MTDLLDLFATADGVGAVQEGVGTALEELGADLSCGSLGGTQLAYEISVVRRADHRTLPLVRPTLVGTRGNEDEGLLLFLAGQQHDMSCRLLISSRHINALGMVREGESTHIGSAVTALDDEGGFVLVVGCAGLGDLANEAYAELIAACLKRKITKFIVSPVTA